MGKFEFYEVTNYATICKLFSLGLKDGGQHYLGLLAKRIREAFAY